jgi:hypothetical protein
VAIVCKSTGVTHLGCSRDGADIVLTLHERTPVRADLLVLFGRPNWPGISPLVSGPRRRLAGTPRVVCSAGYACR